MDKITAFMSKRVAGIPVGIIALIVVGIGLFAALRMKSTPPDTDEVLDEVIAADESAGDGTDGNQPQFAANTAFYTAGTNTVSNIVDTNEAWGRRAKTWLIGTGVTVDLATRAIEKYLAGEEQTTDEVRERDRAVAQFGLPPEEFTYGGTITPETPDTGNDGDTPTTVPNTVPATRQGTPPCVHTVAGPNDNNAPDLARLYYGQTNKELRDLVANANTAQGEPPWRPGTRVRIPKRASATTTPKPEAPTGGNGGGVREGAEQVFPGSSGGGGGGTATKTKRYFVTTIKVRGAQEIAAKNGLSRAQVVALNPGKDFPVKAGVSVRVG